MALFESGQAIAADHQVLGRGHAEHLVPMIAALPDRGRAGKILVSLGPGSFTGVRIGIAAARALAYAWKAEVRGYPTLALVAAMALAGRDADGVTVCMRGGHGEWFIQNFAAGGHALGKLESLSPDAAAARSWNTLIAGNAASALAERIGGIQQAIDILPDAASALLLGPTLSQDTITPIYGRAPDARLPL